jgi:hypothetical protein
MADSAAEKTELQVVAAPAIEKRIFVIRGRQVMLDEDLADLYGVETKRLVQQVKRNLKRFPVDFMFQLTSAEAEALRSQIATSNDGRGGRRYAPYVFTEQGVAMLSGVLRSDRHRGASERARRAVSSDLRSATTVDRAAAQLEAPDRVQGSRGRRVVGLSASALTRFKYVAGSSPVPDCRQQHPVDLPSSLSSL